MIRLLLADDQILFVETLKTVLELRGQDIEVVGLAYNGIEAVAAAERLNPDVILMDVRMPKMDGVEATKIIHSRMPRIRIMMLTTFDDDAYVHDALEGGAVGYLLKNMPSEDLLHSLRAVNRGTLQLSPAVADQLVKPRDGKDRKPTEAEDPPGEDRCYPIEILSRREREVLYLMSRGYDNVQIASRLFIAEQTVKNHISRIYNKLQIHDRMSVMKAARHSDLKEYCGYLLED